MPVLDGVLELAPLDVVPGGTKRNHAFVSPHTEWGELSTPEQLVLADAQTSGGLLIATTDAERMAGELSGRGGSRSRWSAGPEAGASGGRVRATGRLGE